jgi:hypothetical protein
MKIVIRNYLAGSFLLEQEPSMWDAIVILDSGLSHTDFVDKHARRHIYLRFDDVDGVAKGKRMPTLDDIRDAEEFATQSENLMVCCRAGQSRSAAIAFVIGYQRLGPDAACRLLNPERHIPNSLIVDLGAHLNDDPSLVPTFTKWQADNRHIKLSDHFDDIECEFDELEFQGARNRIVTL